MNLKGTKTEANLQTAFAGESQARNKYTFYASKAKKEGYEQIAALFQKTADNEKEHEARYLDLLKNVEENKVFCKEGQVVWVCRNCGHIHVGEKAPEVCPVCAHPQAYFQILAKNY